MLQRITVYQKSIQECVFHLKTMKRKDFCRWLETGYGCIFSFVMLLLLVILLNWATLPKRPDPVQFVQLAEIVTAQTTSISSVSEHVVTAPRILQVTSKSGITPLQYQYTIKWGDTLTRIMKETCNSINELQSINHIENPDLIYADSQLIIRKVNSCLSANLSPSKSITYAANAVKAPVQLPKASIDEPSLESAAGMIHQSTVTISIEAISTLETEDATESGAPSTVHLIDSAVDEVIACNTDADSLQSNTPLVHLGTISPESDPQIDPAGDELTDHTSQSRERTSLCESVRYLEPDLSKIP